MAVLAVQQSSINGKIVAFTAADAGGDSFSPGDRVALQVRNGSAGLITVTVVVPGTQYGQARPDIPVSIAAGAHASIGPFPADVADPDDGLVDVLYSTVTTVTRALVGI